MLHNGGNHYRLARGAADSEPSLKEQGFYHTPAWRRARKLALQRDNFLCQECLRKKRITKATEVHHVKAISGHPSLALTLDNLESLCWDCHELTKPKKRREKTNLRARVICIRDGIEKEHIC